jgi:hypothetical protein
MASNWRNSYQKLGEFLKDNTVIKIEPQSVFIPEEQREAFYSHFDDVRETFLDEHFSRELALGKEISTRFKELEAEVTGLLGIKNEIRVAAPLRWFVTDPVNGMSRPLLNLLFDLLKGKINEDAFEETAVEEAGELFKKQFSAAYERMVILALLKWLKPTQTLTMPLDDLYLYSSSQEGDSQYERISMPPDLSEMKEMIFDYGHRVTYLAPEVIVYSSVLNKYVGIKSGFVGVAWHARLVSEDKEWLDHAPFQQVFTQFNPWPNIIVYLDDQADNLKMIADKTRVCRPEYLIDTVAMADFYDDKTIQRVKDHNRLFNPFIGTAVISREQTPEKAFSELIPEPVIKQEAAEEKPLEQTAEAKSEAALAEPAPGNEAPLNADTGQQEEVSEPLAEEEPALPPINLVNAGYDYTIMEEVFASLLAGTDTGDDPAEGEAEAG